MDQWLTLWRAAERERLMPSQEVLAQRIFHQSQELADLRRHLQQYHALVTELREAIRAAAAEHPDPAWQALERRATEGLKRALATEPVNAAEVMDDLMKVVSAQVRLRPSGHVFAVEGHETLLEAGLRAGLRLNYGCRDGTCGMCKARVVAGEVTRVAPSDYPMSPSERSQGYALLCAHTAASAQLTIEALEAEGPRDIAPQSLVAQVSAVETLAPGTRRLHLVTPRSHRLRFLAGQSVTLGLARAGGDVYVTLPVASCPCDDRNLHFFLGRESGEAFARLVFEDALRPGEPVTVRGPAGDFVLADGRRPLVFAACDTGFAPVKSLVEHALALDTAPSISLFWLATRPDGHFLANQCRAWSEAFDRFEYSPFSFAEPGVGALGVAQAMRADVFDIDCDFYLAGPAPFVAMLGEELRAAGIPQGQIFAEVV